MSVSRRVGGTQIGMREIELLRAPICRHTRLTKPECHCKACLFEQVAAHGGGERAERRNDA